MLEILKYMTSGFWVFVGTFAIVSTVLYYGVNGVVRIVGHITKMFND